LIVQNVHYPNPVKVTKLLNESIFSNLIAFRHAIVVARMENLQVGVVFRGGDTTTECSDVHIRMIHLRQANKRETDLLSFRQLQSEDLFTDMTLVLKVILALFWENHRNEDQLHTLRMM